MHSRRWLVVLCGLVYLFGFSVTTRADETTSVSTDAIINLPLTDTWQLFTTAAGFATMGYQHVQIDMRIDGHVHAEQPVTSTSNAAIDGDIVSYEPEHMISLQHGRDGVGRHWSVLYFTAMGKDMCQVRWVELSAAQDIATLNHEAQAHRELFDRLIRHYAPECELCKREREAAGK